MKLELEQKMQANADQMNATLQTILSKLPAGSSTVAGAGSGSGSSSSSGSTKGGT